MEQVTEMFEALRQDRPIFRSREKRCICWSCVPEVADCCAEPDVSFFGFEGFVKVVFIVFSKDFLNLGSKISPVTFSLQNML
jgi:hypothetical protein